MLSDERQNEQHVSRNHHDAQALPIDAQAEHLWAIDAVFRRMEVQDLADLLEVSVPTVVGNARTAKAFLQNELDLAASGD